MGVNTKDLIAHLKKEYAKAPEGDPRSKVKIEKAESACLYYCYSLRNSTDKGQNAALLMTLFSDNIKNLFIYGEFFPIDFTTLTVTDSNFDGYSRLAQSVFPKDRTVFYYCFFKNVGLKANPGISKIVFDSTCNIPTELIYYLDDYQDIRVKQYQLIKNDLKKFLGSFVLGNVFSQSSFNHLAAHFNSKLDRKAFLDECLNFGVLTFNMRKSNELYSVVPSYQNSVLTLVNQNNLDPGIERFCDMLLKKYYKSS